MRKGDAEHKVPRPNSYGINPLGGNRVRYSVGPSRIFRAKIQCDSMTTRFLFGLLLVSVGMTGRGHHGQARYRVKLVSDQPWAIGEAKPCSFDGQYMEMHCFPPTPEALAAPKHDYLVDADFEKPVKFDAQHWAGGNYPYDIVCRLDSDKHATCQDRGAA
jgi:hypothetical protein